MRFRTVLVPLDGSPQALCVLPVAARVAASEGATLHIVHVGERTAPAREVLEKLGVSDAAIRGAVLDQAAGDPAGEVVRLAQAQRDALIVLSTHTSTEKARGQLGSTTAAVLRHFGCPVLLVPPEHESRRDARRAQDEAGGSGPGRLRRILFPEDGTPATATAMDSAAELARRVGAEVVVLHVAETGSPPSAEPGTLTTPYLDQPQHEWPAWASEFIARMAALGHTPDQVRFRLAVATGDPGQAIVDFAHRYDIDLIVLACIREWGSGHAHTAQAVILRSNVPILLTAAKRALAEAAA